MQERINFQIGHRLLLLMVSVSLIGCYAAMGCNRSSQRSTETLARPITTQCGANTSENVFGDERFFRTDQDNESVQAEYSHYLMFLQEPTLACGEGPDEAYRITVLHSFQANPVVIRITRSNDA